MMLMTKGAALAVALTTTAMAPIALRDVPTKEDAQAAMIRATTYLADEGRSALVASLQRANSPLHDGKTRVFAVDSAGNVVADTIQPQQVGRNLLDLRDAQGSFPYRDVMTMAYNKGQGWVYYTSIDPLTRSERREAALVQSAGGLVLVAARRD